MYAPVPGLGAEAGELLFFDWWKSAEGIGTFFSDAHVQGMASKLFSARDGVVWMPARGAFGFDLPAPAQRPERYVGVVRGAVASPEQAIDVFDRVLSSKLSDARRRGQLSHHVFRFVATSANGAPALAAYAREGGAEYRSRALHLFEFEGSRIGSITAFLDPAVFAHFDVPAILRD